MRGEYLFGTSTLTNSLELPPRARRIPAFSMVYAPITRTTSACAENTKIKRCAHAWRRNYLRVRGEYAKYSGVLRSSEELPPRARRIQFACAAKTLFGGTTSACAENTLTVTKSLSNTRNYLRVRGEYGSLAFRHDAVGELPPRARRIRVFIQDFEAVEGTTSACAENTPSNRY